eukprot:PITA_12528
MFPSWFMSATDANGLYGGLAVLWDPDWISAIEYRCFAAFFSIGNLIIAGDMNFTFGDNECWGNFRKRDLLADSLRLDFLNRDLIDIPPSIMLPTWDNGRSGAAYIAKRIDRFLVHSSLIDKLGMPLSYIELAFISDHRPIVLKWRESGFRLGYPLKFNRTWLEYPDYNSLILNSLKRFLENDASDLCPSLMDRMVYLKQISKRWQLDKKKKDRLLLNELQLELDLLIGSTNFDFFPPHIRCRILEIEHRRQLFLKQEEATWRLKIWALWLKSGDPNTKCFHRAANARRAKNSIWKITDGSGVFYVTQQEISTEAVRYFSSQYRRKSGGDYQDVLWDIELAPQMFDVDGNTNFLRPITEDELLSTLKAFSKDKSLSPDGWTIEFYIHFYELLKLDLIRMVEEARLSGRIHQKASSTLIALIPKKGDAESFHDFRPISLCNISFKIISKIIVERLKPTLASFISLDQHAFLRGRNILNVVAITQEVMFLMKTKSLDATILNVDLQKAYDFLEWGFLRCLLAKIGLNPQAID